MTDTARMANGLGLISATDSAGATSYHLSDGLGSTVQVTDSAGAVTNTYAYDAFGALRSSSETTPNAFRFTGEQQDAGVERGLIYLRARHYDPALGRFLSEDRVPSINRYPYAFSNPVNYTDPTGLWPCPKCDKRAGAVGAATAAAQRTVASVATAAQSVGAQVSAGASWAGERLDAAGDWLATCDWKRIAGGVVVIGGAAVAVAAGGYLFTVGAGGTAVAAEWLAVYEGVHLAAAGGTIAGGGLILGTLGGYAAFRDVGCGERNAGAASRASAAGSEKE